MGHSIDLPEDLTEAQLDGRACIHCAAEDQPMRPVEAWSEFSSQLFECVDSAAAVARPSPSSQPSTANEPQVVDDLTDEVNAAFAPLLRILLRAMGIHQFLRLRIQAKA
jgi:hypothetical protein